MVLKLSCTDFSFPLLEHDRVLAVIAAPGFGGADIGLFEGRGHLKPSRELTKPARAGAALKRKLAAHGLRASDIFLQIHAGFAECAVNHPEAKRREFAREQFARALDYAHAAASQPAPVLPRAVCHTESAAASTPRTARALAATS